MIIRKYAEENSVLEICEDAYSIQVNIINLKDGNEEIHSLSIDDAEDFVFQVQELIRILKDQAEEQKQQ